MIPKVKTVTGDEMLRINPVFAVIDGLGLRVPKEKLY